MKYLVMSLLVGLPLFAGSSLSKSEQKEAKSMLSGKLYTRIDIPCATGRHAYGVYNRPLVEVSPEGVNTDADTTYTYSWWHADSTFWGVSPNMSMKLDDVDFDDNEVEIELEGVDDADGIDTVVKFVNIRSLDDFKKCFEKTFAKVPLQDENPDWPASIKQAIAKRQLVKGMSKKQAFCVTGKPERFEKKGNTEVWYLRQNKGVKTGYFFSEHNEDTGLPSQIKFTDGKISDISGSQAGGFSLED
ncbi:MAG: hypothetical protein H6510_06515 [Acidobacteria bacterium]|nr:hypothetical protein [Acidobacteriota bacterium]MCB9397448.1 hypothetical protein [Acidobacteriota bacterium]